MIAEVTITRDTNSHQVHACPKRMLTICLLLHQEHVKMVNEKMNFHKMPQSLQDKVHQRYALVWTRHREMDAHDEQMARLCPTLKCVHFPT